MNSKLCRALLLGSLLLAAALRPAAAESPTLLRSALIVEDASRSIAFYELLGFRIEMDQANPRKAEGNPFPLNAPSSAVRLVIMQSATGAGGRIGLVEFSRPTPSESRRDPDLIGRGDVVLVFDVADADAVHAAMQRAGARIIEPPQTYTSKKTAADGSPLRGKVFHVRDPDGYLIELLQAPR